MKQFILENLLLFILAVVLFSILIGWLVYRNIKDEEEFVRTINIHERDTEYHPKKNA